ncbi:hypothetical protein SEA_LIFES_81 [Microbacterium phage Lifes]|nr:hypothetical protein SEA_LIFES_81 [Microbacterium phage Lifes]
MSVKDVETYWTAELNEEVEIVPVGWTNMPTEYALYIGGTHVVAYKRLEEIEDYLSRYFCVKGA